MLLDGEARVDAVSEGEKGGELVGRFMMEAQLDCLFILGTYRTRCCRDIVLWRRFGTRISPIPSLRLGKNKDSDI